MVRIATIEDYNTILEMVISFAENSPYSKIMDHSKIEELVKTILTGFMGTVILIDEDGLGFIAGCTTPHPFFKGMIATELAWWVEPHYRNSGVGKDLLASFEAWAKDQECSYITMVSLTEDIGKFYEKEGYVLQERSYIKEI